MEIMKQDSDFIQFLLDNDYLDPSELRGSASSQKNSPQDTDLHWSLSSPDVLVRKQAISQEKFNEALRKYLGIPDVALSQIIDPKAAVLVPEELARSNCLIPYQSEPGILKIAMADPTNERILSTLRIITGLEIRPAYAQEEEIRAAIRRYLTLGQSAARLEYLAGTLSPEPVQLREGLEQDGHTEDAPTLRLIYSVLQEAVSEGVSDIHWEPREKDFVVRYRVDGKLLKKHTLSTQTARTITSSLKVMANMDVAERRIPQDGRMTFKAGLRQVDLRLSSLPTVFGEKIAVRILDPRMAQRSLEDLGMRPEIKAGVQALLRYSNGLILVVGPTGSGKTTTLYALLRELNAEELNIISIEEPVEYQLPGVNQVQVNLAAGLSFAVGLRHILRQDPDVIMIGEIRDEETAKIAVRASLTGHLVLSTLHTNTAAEALERLLDMGLEPYLLASAIRGVLSQRLVRRLCETCKVKSVISEGERKALRLQPSICELYRAEGCPKCLNTGFKGRIGIHELLPYEQEIKELVLARRNSAEIERQAARSGMLTIYEDGLLKVAQGLTTAEEVLFATSHV